MAATISRLTQSGSVPRYSGQTYGFAPTIAAAARPCAALRHPLVATQFVGMRVIDWGDGMPYRSRRALSYADRCRPFRTIS